MIVTIEQFPLLLVKFKEYLEDNEQHLNNRIFAEFIEDDKNKLIFTLNLFSYKNFSLILDKVFREHVFEYKFISYVTTYFYYESVRFDKKIRSKNKIEPIILDSTVNEGVSMKDTLASSIHEATLKNTNSIKEIFSNEKLAGSFQVLTPHQRSILILYYVDGYKDYEIAQQLNVTPQAVSKNKRSAVQRLKKLMEGDTPGRNEQNSEFKL